MSIARFIPPPGPLVDSDAPIPCAATEALSKCPDGIDISLLIEDRRNELRAAPSIDEFRDENDRPVPPPPIREGMNPLRLPP